MTDAERQKRRYDRKKAGLVRIEVWVPQELAQHIRDLVSAKVAMWNIAQSARAVMIDPDAGK